MSNELRKIRNWIASATLQERGIALGGLVEHFTGSVLKALETHDNQSFKTAVGAFLLTLNDFHTAIQEKDDE